ncbi:MAG: dethiobiotin synthase [Gammaproteobacteria bacterium]|nr:dethiobiotin synthase [Gammaproteobacteria bacterium]
MNTRFFITGTDTGIGKTYFSGQLLQHLNAQGQQTIALKPLASGCERTEIGLRNEDACLLQKAASIHLPYEKINPFAFEAPIAPHIAADLNKTAITAKKLAKACLPALNQPADFYLIEGAGGWQVPLNRDETWSDFVKAIQAKVILVVGMRLGCINHALLSVESILQSGCHLVGWVANCMPPSMPHLQENIRYLTQKIKAPLLFGERGFASGIGFDFTGRVQQ